MAKSHKNHFKTLVIKTSLGSIEISLSHKSKKTTQAFIKVVESGIFNLSGNTFYRIVTPKNDTYIASNKLRDETIGVIQGGTAFVDPNKLKTLNVNQTIENFETTDDSKLPHKPGAFALGRSFKDQSASLTEFFIDVEGDLDQLNANSSRYKNYSPNDTLGLPVIGYVSKGMDVVKKIYAIKDKLKTNNQMLRCPVKTGDELCKQKDLSVKIIEISIKP